MVVNVVDSDVVDSDVVVSDVVVSDVDDVEQRSSPLRLIEVKLGSSSPEKLIWKPNSAESPSFPEK